MEKLDFTIETLGQCKIASPVPLSKLKDDKQADFVSDDQYVLYNIGGGGVLPDEPRFEEQVLELAGPRQNIYFDPTKTHAAIVTCGGLCPGLNG